MGDEDTPTNPPESLPEELENAVEQGGTPEPDVVEPETLSDEIHNAQQQSGDPTPRPTGPERRVARQDERNRAAGAQKPKTVEEREAARLERRRRNATLRRTYRARQKVKRSEQRAAAPAAQPEDLSHEEGSGRPKVRQGVVVSDKADKTVVVRIDVVKRHRRYGKIMRTSSKLHVHDERNDAGQGDTVRVVESRPLSATKRWRLTEIVERAR